MTRFGWIEWMRPWRTVLVVASDAVLSALSLWAAFYFRFDYPLLPPYREMFIQALPIFLASRLLVFVWFRLHTGLWKYISVSDLLVILKAVTLSSIISSGAILMFIGHGFPRSVFLMDWFLCVGFISGHRLVIRMLRENYLASVAKGMGDRPRKVLIIGAGDVGEMLLRDIRLGSPGPVEVVGFVDEDPIKIGARIRGVRVVGLIDDLEEVCRKHLVEELIIALPTADKSERRKIIRQCVETGLPFKTVPSVDSILKGQVSLNHLQEVELSDILGREPFEIDTSPLRELFEGACVLITGAAGSIGSELCRQALALAPARLVMLDRSESGLFFLEHDLRRSFPDSDIRPIVGDILNERMLTEVFHEHRPRLVFHAAAYKHVPMMEASPLEAIANNVFGTETVCRAAAETGTERVVLISSDKAVDPVSVMGMTKRVSEGLMRAMQGSATRFMAVRFGNVFGSDGSVLPLFVWQLSKGGPITVTDERATRYFMLISEAAKLVIQASRLGKGGEIFFLDMGEPVRILDMAKNLIRFSGEPLEEERQIVRTGLRPGEKLAEVLQARSERVLPSAEKLIFQVSSRRFDGECFGVDLEDLRGRTEARQSREALEKLKEMADRY